MDFQFDVTTDGRPIKIASIIDEYTRHGSRAGRAVDADVSLVFVWDAFAVWLIVAVAGLPRLRRALVGQRG